MKKTIAILSFWFPAFICMFGQRPDFAAWIYKNGPPDQLFAYVGKNIDIELSMKNEDGNVIYIEHFNTDILIGGFVSATFGLGTVDPNSIFDDHTEAFNDAWSICSKITIHDDTGDIIVMGVEDEINAAPQALFAGQADDAKALNGTPYTDEDVLAFEWTGAPEKFHFLLARHDGVAPDQQKDFVRLPLTEVLQTGVGYSEVDGVDLSYLNVGTDQDHVFISPRVPIVDLIKSWNTFCPKDMEHLRYVLEAKAPVVHRSGNLTHTTAAIYAENINDPLGVGLFANAAARGTYSQGQTGVLGITNGSGSGAATWSRVGSAPAAGGFKYGMMAEDLGQPDSWAAAVFGNGFYTGVWMQSSDARLKTEIRTASHGLNTILKMRPSQYRYVENTPYNLPKGIHHGFIAQEVEEILPELVSDITMPGSMDPDQMMNSGTESYKAVNYIELIPILTAAMQELNAKVDAQAAQIQELIKALKACSKPN